MKRRTNDQKQKNENQRWLVACLRTCLQINREEANRERKRREREGGEHTAYYFHVPQAALRHVTPCETCQSAHRLSGCLESFETMRFAPEPLLLYSDCVHTYLKGEVNAVSNCVPGREKDDESRKHTLSMQTAQLQARIYESSSVEVLQHTATFSGLDTWIDRLIQATYHDYVSRGKEGTTPHLSPTFRFRRCSLAWVLSRVCF